MVSGFRLLAVLSWLLLLQLAACTPSEDEVLPSDTSGTDTQGGPTPDASGPGGSTEPIGTGLDATSTSATDTDGSTGHGSTGHGSTGEDPVCGNGIVEDGEDCDDEGESGLCDADCTPAACGDGHVNPMASEECDDMGESETCNSDCTVSGCGDGIVNATAQEDCDDGGRSAACDVDCSVAECGDGVFNAAAGELCDEGGVTALCDADCTPVACGDGFVNVTAGEDCDDGGESVTCNSDCSFSACGDGITNATAGEGCDDVGESLSCDADCSLAACGDGTTNATAGEACDDGGESSACDDDCSPAACGDGHVNASSGEECDGAELAASTCQDLGFSGGTLACAPGCAYDAAGCWSLPGIPVLALGFSPIKQFDFGWTAVEGADYYQLEESAAPGEPFVQLGGDMVGESISVTMPLHFRHAASYRLRACNVWGCTDSAVVDVVSSLAEAVGFVKASNTNSGDDFGGGVALSDDGNTLAVGARHERSNATGIDGDQANNTVFQAGAVYVFVRDDMGGWSQQAYIKASNTGGDGFGGAVALSADGNTLAVGATGEDSGATGIDGNQADNSASNAGAVYVFVRDPMNQWSQQAYIKASNTDAGDALGSALRLSDDGNTLAVSAASEGSGATGIDGNQADDTANNAGAVYVFVRDPMNQWSQQAYIKASNTDAGDYFGLRLALSGEGNTIAVGALYEDSAATGIDGDQAGDTAADAGAVYVFARDGIGTWSQQAYVKASNTASNDQFGLNVALSDDGNTLAVGARFEDSAASGIGGDQADDAATDSGAVYVFVRDMGAWTQQAYVKASNTDSHDHFGWGVALAGDGNVLAVGAVAEDSNATGIDGDQTNESASYRGAVYVFARDGVGAWAQRAYVKASNTGSNDYFGWSMALTEDGSTLAVGAVGEDSNATGVGGDQANNSAADSGAVFLY